MKKKVLISLVVVLVILNIIGIYTTVIMNSPKNKFLSVLSKQAKKLSNDDLFSYLDEFYSKSNINSKGKLSLNIEVSKELGVDNSYLDPINKSYIEYNNNYNLQEQLLNSNIKTIYNGETLLNFDVVLGTNEYYLYLHDIYDKYLKIPTAEIELNKSIEIEEVEYISKLIFNSTIKSLKDSNFKVSNEEITVKGTKYKVKKNTLELTSEDMMSISINVLNDIKNDSKAMKIINKFNYSEEEINNDKIDKFIEEIKNENSDNSDKLYISLYYDNKDLRKLEANTLDPNEKFEVIIYKENDINKYEMSNDDFKNKVIFYKKNSNTYNIIFMDSKNTGLNFEFYNKRNIIDNNSISTESKFTLEYIYEGKKYVSAVFSNEEISTKIDSMPKVDTSNNINIEDVTYEDQEKIINGIIEKLRKIKLVDDLYSTYNYNYEDEYNYDDGYDYENYEDYDYNQEL